jgi:hypothetical protein
MWKKETRNPFEKGVFDEGWEEVEIKQGVKQVVIEKEEEKKDGSAKDNKRISK